MDNSTQLQIDAVAARHNNHDLFSDHYLDVLLNSNRQWRLGLSETEQFLAWLKELYAQEKSQLSHYSEEQLEQHWFRPILTQLGHVYETQAVIPALQTNGGHPKRPDYVFFATEETRQAAVETQKSADYAAHALAIGEVKKWNVSLSKKQRSGDASFEAQNPSWQIDYYLRATGLKWSILSNGKTWRLVHADTSYKLSVYYEVDLIDLLTWGNVEALRYFVLFFRQAAFLPDDEGRHFLDEVLAGSRDYAVGLERDLRDNAYLALEQLMQGFLDVKQNGLTEADLPAVFENSLYLLYRLLFILYGESQNLLPMKNPIYREQYSLKALKLPDTNKSLLMTGKRYWYYLQTLFEIINGDDPHTNQELGIPRYNGGLFDPQQHPFLVENIIGDRAFVEALRLLSKRTYNGLPQNVDYRALGVRQLGSIYEGLLEYQPRYATEEMACVRNKNGERWKPAHQLSPKENVIDRRQPGQVYLTTDRGERKATGSYYTPDYIVKYIVENTLGPLVEAVRERLKQQAKQAGDEAGRKAVEQSFADEVLNLQVLDPAMGSGHFLVEATDFLARTIVTDPYLEHQTALETDLVYWKRRVVERCIYGVDKNPMAVELAKLSLWLSTVAADRPLSFLDHHLRCGDALVGARVADLGDAPPLMLNAAQKQARRREAAEGARQANIFEQRLSEKLPVVMGRILEIAGRESATYEDVQAKEAIDRAVSELKRPFEAVANLWASAYFGHNFSHDEYDEAVERIAQPGELFKLPAVQRAQQMAGNTPPSIPPKGGEEASSPLWGELEGGQPRRFFHWEIDLPEVF